MSKKILVVDDDEGIIDAISLILEEEDYTVKGTTKCGETFDMVSAFEPDLILLDVLMSGSDGRHICSELKKGVTTKNIPIVMISAHPTAEKSALLSGADDFLEKPFDTADLIKKVENYIHQ